MESHDMRTLRLALGALASLGFLASLTAHVAALQGIDVETYVPFVWLLHGGIFVVFVPFILMARRVYGNRLSAKEMANMAPPWVRTFGAALFAYAMVNFVIFILHTQGGNATERDGQFLLMQHGTLIRHLTSAEYASFRANQVRGFSGHWMVFYFVSAAYFLFHRPPAAVTATAPRG